MIFDYKCLECDYKFEAVPPKNKEVVCPKCGKPTERLFKATTNFHIPSYFHTSKSDIFSYEEWQDLKKNPDIERAR